MVTCLRQIGNRSTVPKLLVGSNTELTLAPRQKDSAGGSSVMTALQVDLDSISVPGIRTPSRSFHAPSGGPAPSAGFEQTAMRACPGSHLRMSCSYPCCPLRKSGKLLALVSRTASRILRTRGNLPAHHGQLKSLTAKPAFLWQPGGCSFDLHYSRGEEQSFPLRTTHQ
jgi:hypothetical protein